MTPDFFPRERFYCLLDDQPDHLVPARLVPPPDTTGPLLLNPLCWFAWQGAPPPDLARRIGPVEAFFDTPWIVWVDDAATRSLAPFWLGPELAHWLVDRVPGQALDTLPRPELLANLLLAGVVVAPDDAARRRQRWTAASRHYAAFLPRGLVAMDDLLHPFHLAALRRYLRHATRTGRFRLGDGQTERRYIAHEEPVARFFHRQLAARISDVVGSIVDPSYSYAALYQGGADLAPHTDRKACEYTLSVAIDATPEPDAEVPWPLHVQAAEETVTAWQCLGDGLLFRGRQLSHWRDRLDDDRTASSILFHFVDHGVEAGDD